MGWLMGQVEWKKKRQEEGGHYSQKACRFALGMCEGDHSYGGTGFAGPSGVQ